MTPPVVLVPGFATSAARTWGDNGWVDLLADMGRVALPLDVLGSGIRQRPTRNSNSTYSTDFPMSQSTQSAFRWVLEPFWFWPPSIPIVSTR